MDEYVDVLSENGDYLGYSVTREEAHKKGLWHRAVVVFIVNSKNQVLLQRRSSFKKTWPNMLDVSVGGHCNTNEFGYETAIRETFEELGVKIEKQDILFIGCTKNSVVKENMIDNMFNEYYIALKNLDASTLNLQKEEVSEAKFFSLDELKTLMDNGYKELTPKVEAYKFLLKFLKKQNILI